MTEKSNEKAIVLFSGGMDSTVCLMWALERWNHVETIGFDYGQPWSEELTARKAILRGLDETEADHVVKLEPIKPWGQRGLPATFVPGRNLLFLLHAATIAYRHRIKHIVIGACQTDYSGYPDCRANTIQAMQLALNLGMDANFVIHTPLMHLTKAQTWQMADDLNVAVMVIHMTHTCYANDHKTANLWGYGCRECAACQLRAKGFAEWQDKVKSTGTATSTAQSLPIT